MKDKDVVNAILAAMIMGGAEEQKQKTKIPRETAKKLGEELFQVHLGFVDAGFTEEQSIKLVAAFMGGK